MTTPPTECDCERALAALQDYLKHEADPGSAAQLEAHLQRCAPCLAHARFERNFVELLEHCARQIRCPDALRLRITTVLAESAAPPER
ncbi:MAG TPA: zf-HC2 domain-containing protein [Gemmatimonadales bacterium]|nr:zf-HC2 domain-containing protein [Gemmatimonadales bacterium]